MNFLGQQLSYCARMQRVQAHGNILTSRIKQVNHPRRQSLWHLRTVTFFPRPNLCQLPIHLSLTSVAFSMSCKPHVWSMTRKTTDSEQTHGVWLLFCSDELRPWRQPWSRNILGPSVPPCVGNSAEKVIYTSQVCAETWRIRRIHARTWRADTWIRCWDSNPRDMLEFKR